MVNSYRAAGATALPCQLDVKRPVCWINPSEPALVFATRQLYEIDALALVHVYGLTQDELAHILSGFALEFPDTAAGQQKKAALLAVYRRMTKLQSVD